MYPLTNNATVLIAIRLIPPVAIALGIPPEAVSTESELPMNLSNLYLL